MRESIDCLLKELESVETVRRHLLAIFGGSVVNFNRSSFPYREVERFSRIVWLRRTIPLSSPYGIVESHLFILFPLQASLLGFLSNSINPNPN